MKIRLEVKEDLIIISQRPQVYISQLPCHQRKCLKSGTFCSSVEKNQKVDKSKKSKLVENRKRKKIWEKKF